MTKYYNQYYILYLYNEKYPNARASVYNYNKKQVKYYMDNLTLNILKMINNENTKYNINLEKLDTITNNTEFLKVYIEQKKKYADRKANIKDYKKNKAKLLKLLYDQLIIRFKRELSKTDSDEKTKNIALKSQYKKLLEEKIRHYRVNDILKADLELGSSVESSAAPVSAPTPAPVPFVSTVSSRSTPTSDKMKPLEYTDDDWDKLTPLQKFQALDQATLKKQAASGSTLLSTRSQIEPFSFQALYDAISHYN